MPEKQITLPRLTPEQQNFVYNYAQDIMAESDLDLALRATAHLAILSYHRTRNAQDRRRLPMLQQAFQDRGIDPLFAARALASRRLPRLSDTDVERERELVLFRLARVDQEAARRLRRLDVSDIHNFLQPLDLVSYFAKRVD